MNCLVNFFFKARTPGNIKRFVYTRGDARAKKSGAEKTQPPQMLLLSILKYAISKNFIVKLLKKILTEHLDIKDKYFKVLFRSPILSHASPLDRIDNVKLFES